MDLPNNIQQTNPPLSTSSFSEPRCPQTMSNWFVIRVTYGRERKLAALLDERNIKYFLPEKTVFKNRPKDGKLFKRKVSVIPNVIFIFAERPYLQALKKEIESSIPMRYMMDRSTRQPAIVQKKQMEDFIRVASSDEDALLYLDNPDVVLEKGEPVEIIYGPFAGITGYVLRIRRDRKIVLTIEGLIAAAITAEVKPDWIKRINKPTTD